MKCFPLQSRQVVPSVHNLQPLAKPGQAESKDILIFIISNTFCMAAILNFKMDDFYFNFFILPLITPLNKYKSICGVKHAFYLD